MNIFKVAFSLLLFVMICISSGSSVWADGGYRVIVMGDDSDTSTVKRSSDIYKRVIAEARRPMRQKDFDVLDEDILSAQMGFVYKQGMGKKDIIQAVMIANKSKNVNTMSRFLVLMRIHVFPETMSFTKQIHTRIDGEIYDINNALFIDAYEIPEQSFPVPMDCNDLCLVEQAGSHARELSSDLGATLAKQLTLYLGKGGSVSNSSSVGNRDDLSASNSFTLSLKNFKLSEITQIVQSIREDAPRTLKLELVETTASQRRYQLVTRVPGDKIIDNITELLAMLNISEDDIKASFSNQTLSIEKLK